MQADAALDAALAALDAARECLDAARAYDNGGGQAAPGPMLLSFGKAAEVAGVSRTRVFTLVREGVLIAVEVPGSGRMIRLADLEAFVAGLEEAG